VQTFTPSSFAGQRRTARVAQQALGICKPPAVPVALRIASIDLRVSRLLDQSESAISRSCGSTTALSVVAARVQAGNCSTVARWPAHKRVTRTNCPPGNSSAS